MEKIRILFYTDSRDISENLRLWGLTDLRHFIQIKLSSFVNIQVDILNRHIDYENQGKRRNAATKFTSTLLGRYDELWVFGVLQKNTDKFPENELTPTEVENLREWMRTGGVLITGDHSEVGHRQSCSSDHKSFLNIGRALGQKIPRAGELRVWLGPPTGCHDGPLELRDNHNTQEGSDLTLLDTTSPQMDPLPQTLYLDPAENPHPLFLWYVDLQTQRTFYISKFPDHLHEGELYCPKPQGDDWTHDAPPPVVVARGRDKRFPDAPRYYDLVSVFEGTHEEGRIVADSSFHHYINRNLVRLDGRDLNNTPTAKSDLDQIAQYYANVALWLAPIPIRQRLAWGLLLWAARHPDVYEERANSASVIGSTAMAILEDEIGTSNISRIFASLGEQGGQRELKNLLSAIVLQSSSTPLADLNSENLLGEIMREYHRSFERIEEVDPAWIEIDPNSPQVVFQVISRVLADSPGLLNEFTSCFQGAAAALSVSNV